MQITPSDRVTSRVKQKISIKHFIKDIENKASEALIEENESIKSVQPENKYSRAPSKFIKPAKISDELALFIGIKKGTLISRIEVTREINKYIRTNNLENGVCKHKINPDNKLSTLFKLNDNDELTYYNIQKYIGLHFI